MRENEIDVLVTNTATASFIARLRALDVPVVYFCHGLHWNRGRRTDERVWQMLEEWALRETAAVIVINDDDEAWFQSRAGQRPILRLKAGVGVPIDRFPRVELPDSKELRLLWVGEFSPRKRPKLALDVFERILKQRPDATLRMLGEGDLRAGVQSEIARRGLGGRVDAPGRADDIDRQMAASHALLHTATWEGLPRVALEALAVGRPVFAFDVKGVRSLPSASLVADADTQALARVILSFDWAAVDSVLPEVNDLDSGTVADEISTFLSLIASGSRA